MIFPSDQQASQKHSDHRAASVASLYALIATIWILAIELLLPRISESIGISTNMLELLGHVSFVALPAILLFFLLQKQQQKTAQLLATTEEQLFLLKQFYELPFVGMAITSPQTRQWLQMNERFCQILGYSKEELLQLNWMAITHPDDLDTSERLVEQMQKGERDFYEVEKRYIRKDQQIIHVRVNVSCQRNAQGTINLYFATVEDITEQVRRSEEIKTLSRLYRVISNINQAIVRHTTQEQVFKDACDIAVCDGKFRMAWIGLLQPDGQLNPVASAGESGDYLEYLNISLSDSNSTGPTVTALRQGHHVVCNDICNDPNVILWRERALALDYQASAAFPLLVNGKIRGAFSLYSNQVGFFDAPELELLDEVASDIAFAIHLIDAEQASRETMRSLEESQSKLLLAMEAANLSMWDVDLDTGHASVSDNYYTQLGFEPQSFPVTLDWWYSRMHPEERGQCRISMQIQLTEKRHRVGLEYRFQHNDGSWHWIAGTGTVVDRNAKGEATRLVGVNMDITSRINMDLQHQRDAERANGLLALATAESTLEEKELLQFGLDLAEKLTESNIGFLHFVNEDQQSIELVTWSTTTQKHCQAVFDQHYPLDKAGIWADCCAQRKPVICNDYQAAEDTKGLPQGHFPLNKFISVPTTDNDKVRLIMGVGNRASPYTQHEVDSVQLIANDLWRIVRRRRAESALVENLKEQLALNTKLDDAHNQLVQSEKLAAIGQLAAGVAHELNNPIGFVHSNFGAMERYVTDLLDIIEAYQALETQMGMNCPQSAEIDAIIKAKDYAYIRSDLPQLINESKEGLSRVRRIVQDLKDFSRTGESSWEWADLHSGLDSTLNILWNELKYKCTVNKKYGDLPEIFCLASQLNQVFMNLLVNAGHAIEKKGEITIQTGVTDQRVWVEISDTGKGIPPEHLTKIFDPFFTTKPVGQGTGLGLSLSYSIMQRHRGSLTVRSKVGVGSTFRVELPIKPDHAAAKTPKEEQYE